jgi:hypothetical protein
MGDELATTNVNRTYSLGATSIAIFTFMLFFLYPRFASGEIYAVLFQVTLVVMGVATFSFVFASLYYYGSSLGSRTDEAERTLYYRSLLGARLHAAVPGSEPDPLLGPAHRRRVRVVRTLAVVLTVRDPLLPQGPDRAKESRLSQRTHAPC